MRRCILASVAAVTVLFLSASVCQAQPTAYRVSIEGGTGGGAVDGVETFTGLAAGDVTACVFIDSNLEEICAGPGGPCDATEAFTVLGPGNIPTGVFGCSDGADNDGDGFTDSDDSDCNGIQGWSLSVNTGACFGVATASTQGTIAALVLTPPGLRDFQSFEKTEVVDPAKNGDLQGVVSAVVLSLSNPVIAPQIGTSKVLVITGVYDGSDACPVTVIDPANQGLAGSGEPVKTAITVSGETEVPGVTNALISAGVVLPPEDCAVVGDEDENGLADCDDPACADDAVNCPPENCDVEGDEDGNGLADCEDPVCPACIVPEDCDVEGDEDGNGLADCEDEACPPCVVPEDCDVEGDEDGNGLADCEDAVCPPCVVPEDCDVEGDEDGNGLADCEDEACPPCVVPEDCDVEGDEDGNGLADCEDEACPPCVVPEDCDVVGDEDGNGLADCEDAACPPCMKPEPDPTAESGFRVEIEGGTSDEAGAGLPSASSVVNWTIGTDGTGSTDVTVNVILQSAVEPCQSDPTACTGAENFITTDPAGIPTGFGCSDGMDNDGNGLTDSEDPDCSGVQGWSLSVITEDCFNVASATTAGTVASLVLTPPGMRDFQSFEKTEVVDPAKNLGVSGVVSAVVLSLSNPVTLNQTLDSLVLVIGGSIDGTGTGEGQMTDPCAVSVSDPTEAGLAGSGEPVKTAVTISGETDVPVITNASIQLVGPTATPMTNLLRGDPNGDSKINIADAVYIISALFRDGAGFACGEAADANGDGNVDGSDATFVISYRFMGGPAPADGCATVENAADCDTDTCEL